MANDNAARAVGEVQRLAELEERVAALTAEVAGMRAAAAEEVRTRRLVVVDAGGAERAVIETRATDPLEIADESDFVHLELLSPPDAPEGANACVDLYAGSTATLLHGGGRGWAARASVGAASALPDDPTGGRAEVAVCWHPAIGAGDEPSAEGVLNLRDSHGRHRHESSRRTHAAPSPDFAR